MNSKKRIRKEVIPDHYCGWDPPPNGQRRGTTTECISDGQISYYGITHLTPEELNILTNGETELLTTILNQLVNTITDDNAHDLLEWKNLQEAVSSSSSSRDIDMNKKIIVEIGTSIKGGLDFWIARWRSDEYDDATIKLPIEIIRQLENELEMTENQFKELKSIGKVNQGIRKEFKSKIRDINEVFENIEECEDDKAEYQYDDKIPYQIYKDPTKK